MGAVLLVVLTPLSSLADTNVGNLYSSGGSAGTILIEEHTATYCQTCADIDPMVLSFLEDNGNRAIRIAMHPPGADPLGSEISTYRLSLTGDSLAVTPTFVMDGEVVSQGLVDRTDMQINLRSSELSKKGIFPLGGEVLVTESGILVKSPGLELDESQELTIFITERIVDLAPGTASNGMDRNHDVARAMISVQEDGNVGSLHLPDAWSYQPIMDEEIIIDFDLGSEDTSKFDVILVLESTESESRSVLSSTIIRLSPGDPAAQGANPAAIVLALAGVSTMVFIYQSRR